MRIAPMIAGAIVALSMSAAATPSIAAPALPDISTAAPSNVEHVDWRGRHWRHRHWGGGGGGGFGYCRSWRHECAARWGWGTWRFRRCMNIHGC